MKNSRDLGETTKIKSSKSGIYVIPNFLPVIISYFKKCLPHLKYVCQPFSNEESFVQKRLLQIFYYLFLKNVQLKRFNDLKIYITAILEFPMKKFRNFFFLFYRTLFKKYTKLYIDTSNHSRVIDFFIKNTRWQTVGKQIEIGRYLNKKFRFTDIEPFSQFWQSTHWTSWMKKKPANIWEYSLI